MLDLQVLNQDLLTSQLIYRLSFLPQGYSANLSTYHVYRHHAALSSFPLGHLYHNFLLFQKDSVSYRPLKIIPTQV